MPPLKRESHTPSTTGVAPARPAAVWHDGNLIVAAQGGVLPFRCVKCNATVDSTQAIRKNFVWLPHAAWLTLLAGEVVHFAIGLLVRKTGTITFCLCDKHLARCRRARRVAWVLIPTGASALLAGGLQVLLSGAEPVSECIAALGGVLSVAALVSASVARPLRPKRMDNNRLRLKGACPEFLEQLPILLRL